MRAENFSTMPPRDISRRYTESQDLTYRSKIMIDKKNIMDIAKRECKGDATTEEIEWLQAPENRLAWCQALLTALSDYESSAMYHRERVNMMAQDVKLGVVSHKDYLAEKDRFDTWHRKSQRYRNGISERLSQVKTLLAEDKTISHIDEIASLTSAIIKHKRASEESEAIPEVYDLVLWSSISVLE